MADKNKTGSTKKDTPKTPTFVSLIKAVWVNKHKNKKEVVAEVLANAKRQGVTKNAKGIAISEKNVTSLLNAMCRDVTQERKGWWNTFNIVQSTEKGKENFQVVSKA